MTILIGMYYKQISPNHFDLSYVLLIFIGKRQIILLAGETQLDFIQQFVYGMVLCYASVDSKPKFWQNFI